MCKMGLMILISFCDVGVKIMVTANCFHSLHGEKLLCFQECKPKHIFLLVAVSEFSFALTVAPFPKIFYKYVVQQLGLILSGTGCHTAS